VLVIDYFVIEMSALKSIGKSLLKSSNWRRIVCSKFATNVKESNDPSKFPLHGVKILDLTRIIAGPYCTMVLSDLGADVIKVEKPFVGDDSRKWGPPFLNNSEDSVYFLACNRNKRSVCIDLKKGLDLIYELATKCDVLIENYVPGKLDQMKLGYEDVRKVAPSIIYCSITGFGSVGPYAKRPGYDVIAASMGGLLHITGEQEGDPVKVGVAITDIATGLYAHGAILAALYQRSKTDKGTKIDVDLFSTQIACLINVGVNYLNAGKEAKRWGTQHESIVPYSAFKTKNGYLTVGAGNDNQYRNLCQLLSAPELIENPKFKDNQKRVENRRELVGTLSGIFKNQTNEYWMDKFREATFPCAPINNMQQVFNDPHVKSIDLVKKLKHKTAGDVKVVGPPVVFSDALNSVRFAPPILGQHTDQVLKEYLDYNDEKIEDLKRRKIIQ
jgi:succinate--hydroxymethylglutarate CoA-transferase